MYYAPKYRNGYRVRSYSVRQYINTKKKSVTESRKSLWTLLDTLGLLRS